MRHVWAAAVAIGVAGLVGAGCGTPASAPARPSLLVVLVVDQMRADYVERFADRWAHGFRRLLDKGARFDRAAYPYLNTVTCAGHATIGTGTFPATHGVVLNEWWRRDDGRRLPCTANADVHSVPYGGAPEATGHGAGMLRVPTLADRLRDHAPAARVVTLSMKARSAIMLAGHGGTAVTWFGENTHAWATSSAFAATPVAEVAAHLAAHPRERLRDAVWVRALDPGAYDGVDDTPFEQPKPGWTPAFPHPLAGAPGTPPDQFDELWKRSPYADAYLGEMAASLVERFGLGRGSATEFLGVSFSGLDYIGHDFGPESHEVQDALVRLDRIVGDLIAALDRHVGRERYVLALTSDHGVAPIPEQAGARGERAGRLLGPDIRSVAEAALAALGEGPHVARVEYTDLYLTPATAARVAAEPGRLDPLVEALRGMDGVLRVFRRAELTAPGARESTDPVLRAAALSHHPAESGDLIVVPEARFVMSGSSATTHGTLHAYDQRVPLFFFGAGVRAGAFAEDASPADIAPTLGHLAGVPLPGVDGRVLTEALSAAVPVTRGW